MAEQVKLGSLLGGIEQRDAIHIAIAPVVAGERLKPGTHVGFIGDESARDIVGCCKSPIGIVDPFLNFPEVHPGQRFYLLLYPGTITSLRHEWTHPDFVTNTQTDCTLAEKLLRRFADNKGMDYEFLMSALGSGGHVGDREEYCDEIPDEVWDWFEAVTGGKADRSSYFSCAC